MTSVQGKVSMLQSQRRLTPIWSKVFVYGAVTIGMALVTSLTMAEPATSSVSNLKAESNAVDGKLIPSVATRFANSETEAVPDFQRHIMPLLGRLGCNGRACHGSFQGRGGFQLSLFGYDFQADHKALLDEDTGRVDVDDVAESLILAKPVDADMHEGGKLLDEGTWQFTTLRNWIRAGAKFTDNAIQELTRLEIQPSEIQFGDDQSSVELVAIAHWSDGSREDVTDLCRFSSNDDGIAAIDDTGLVKSGLHGDTHVVVYYDRAAVPVPVIRPVESSKTVEIPSTSDHPIDQLVQAKLDKLGVIPSGLCTDAEFIRRVSLDITGTLPAAEEVRQFLADTSADKRDRLIDDLLDSPGYAAWWATRFSDWSGNSDEQLNNVLPVRGSASRLWYEWLRVRLEDNVPYDELIEGIVVAESRQDGESYLEYCDAMTKACKPGNEDVFASRDGLPLYWARRNFQKPEDRAIGFAYAFLGVRIECAQCHKHPFDQWSKDDFDQFSKLFAGVSARGNGVSPDSKAQQKQLIAKITEGKKLNGGDLRRKTYEAARAGKTVPFMELYFNDRGVSERARKAKQLAKKKGRKVSVPIPTGTILGQPVALQLDHDPRGELMDWLRDPNNPYFARAIVNRVWSNYFGIGIINPTDDMNPANPPSNAALLDYLAKEFIAQDYDLKWLSRTIAKSDAYQRSTTPNATNQSDRINFARHIPRRLPAEVIHDAVLLATESSKEALRMRAKLDDMAIAADVPQARNNKNFALQVFGQSERETNCDCDRSDSPSLLQSIYLRNDFEIYKRLGDKNGWVAQACKSIGAKIPGQAPDPRQMQLENKAKGFQKSLVARINRFNQLSPEKKERSRAKLVTEIKRALPKFKQYGYEVPKLSELLRNPKNWTLEKTEDKVAENPEMSLEQLVEEAYLRTLSRYPEDEETEISLAYINESKTPSDGIQSLMWALVNTKEFIITH